MNTVNMKLDTLHLLDKKMPQLITEAFFILRNL
jgi:hypothetical protein